MAGTDGRKKEFARWPAFERKYKEAFSKVISKLSEMPKDHRKKKNSTENSYTKWIDEETMFNWWMEEGSWKDDPDQTVMFE